MPGPVHADVSCEFENAGLISDPIAAKVRLVHFHKNPIKKRINDKANKI